MDPIDTADAAEAETAEEWYARIEEIGEEAGYFQPLGDAHSAFFSDQGTTLLVSFERAEDIRERNEDKLPSGFALAREHGWSHLCLIAEGETWYRDRAVYGYFDRLVDDAFFEDFDHIVFFGSGMGAYAAAAYSVTAPGANVVIVQPAATLDPRIAEWDERHRRRRRLSFTDRYGYAPDMIEGAGQVFVLFDPEDDMDAMHAALFTRPFVTKLPCRNLGHEINESLTKMSVMPRALALAAEGKLTADAFYRLYRRRRTHGPYLRNLLARLQEAHRPYLAALMCRSVIRRMKAPLFRRQLKDLMAELDALGLVLPPEPDMGEED